MAVPVPPHRARLPDPAGLFKKLDDADRSFLNELIGALQRELDRRVLLDTGRAELLLFSPSGNKIYAVTVSETGTLAITLRSDTT